MLLDPLRMGNLMIPDISGAAKNSSKVQYVNISWDPKTPRTFTTSRTMTFLVGGSLMNLHFPLLQDGGANPNLPIGFSATRCFRLLSGQLEDWAMSSKHSCRSPSWSQKHLGESYRLYFNSLDFPQSPWFMSSKHPSTPVVLHSLP